MKDEGKDKAARTETQRFAQLDAVVLCNITMQFTSCRNHYRLLRARRGCEQRCILEYYRQEVQEGN